MLKQHFPEPTVGGLIVGPDGKILLIKSYKWKNLYVIPGGHIELGEKIHEALKREIKEETGLDIYDIRFINYYEHISEPTFWKKRHFIFLDFLAKTKSTRVHLDEEGQAYIWITPKEALNLPLETYTRKVINKYLT